MPGFLFVIRGLFVAGQLFVVSNDGFKQVAEPLIATSFVLAGHLQQEPFQLVETAETVACNGVGQARTEHHELMLPFILWCAGGPAYRVVKPTQLTAGTGIHIAHPADHDVGLIVEIEAVGDELLDFDVWREVAAFGKRPVATWPISAGATIAAWTIPAWTVSAGTSVTTVATLGAITLRTITLRAITLGTITTFTRRTIATTRATISLGPCALPTT